MKKENIGIIGTGNMGEALIRGIVASGRFLIYATDKKIKRLSKIAKSYPIKKANLKQLTKTCKTIIVCVKPQDIDELLFNLGGVLTNKHLVISIAAGVTTKHIEKFFKVKIPVVRVMPNMPGLIKMGISAYCLGKYASANSVQITRFIFSHIGQTIEICEKKMNVVTALSGSGPGFIAYLAKAFIAAANSAGLEKDIATILFTQTLKGTAHLMTQINFTPEVILAKVASKGGTTQAGLRIFAKRHLPKIIQEAILAASKRSRQLSKG